MKKTIEIKATTVDLAIEQGLLELVTTLEKVEVEILSKGGLFQKAVIKMSTIETPAEIAEDFVNEILSKMNLNATAKAEEKSNCIYIDIEGEDSKSVIGYRGEALDAIQYLTLTVVNNGEKGKFKKVVVNAENYREKREETLVGLAQRLADKAFQTAHKIVLEPMNPYERRIIHATLQDSEIAETTSEGEEPNRHVVIIPKGVEILGTLEASREANRDNSRRNNTRSSGGYNNSRNSGGYKGNNRNSNGRSSGYAQRNDRKGSDDRRERSDRAPRDSYEDYDHIEANPQEPVKSDDYAPFEAVKKTSAPKYKSFGGSKKFPF